MFGGSEMATKSKQMASKTCSKTDSKTDAKIKKKLKQNEAKRAKQASENQCFFGSFFGSLWKHRRGVEGASRERRGSVEGVETSEGTCSLREERMGVALRRLKN